MTGKTRLRFQMFRTRPKGELERERDERYLCSSYLIAERTRLDLTVWAIATRPLVCSWVGRWNHDGLCLCCILCLLSFIVVFVAAVVIVAVGVDGGVSSPTFLVCRGSPYVHATPSSLRTVVSLGIGMATNCVPLSAVWFVGFIGSELLYL